MRTATFDSGGLRSTEISHGANKPGQFAFFRLPPARASKLPLLTYHSGNACTLLYETVGSESKFIIPCEMCRGGSLSPIIRVSLIKVPSEDCTTSEGLQFFSSPVNVHKSLMCMD